MTLKMQIYSTVKGFPDFQTPLRPPMNNQKSFKLHICILWSHVVTFPPIPVLSLILFIYGTPPKSAPARKCRKNPDILGDLWPRKKQFTKMKLSQFVNLSLIHSMDQVWFWYLFSFMVRQHSQICQFSPREQPFWNILCFIEQFHVPLQQDVELDIGS